MSKLEIKISSKRVKLGGAQYKQIAKAKSLKLEELKRKTPKLETFFTSSKVSTYTNKVLIFLYLSN